MDYLPRGVIVLCSMFTQLPVRVERPSVWRLDLELAVDYKEAMVRALRLARRAGEAGDVPVGAVVLDEAGEVIGQGFNDREAAGNPVGHAEVNALVAAAKQRGGWRLEGCTLVVTLEPCTMCAGAVVASRVPRLVFGTWDPKAGACGSVRDVVRDSRLNHQVEVVAGVLEHDCEFVLRRFFASRRNM
ncbi:nucleoside deaminase [Gleimia hominis]|uniref:tRNA-specific adenosine deaminase n=1 Tax=Gleimia hominis TaxID=595468 RepID=A0ABU3I8W1_9ACTO|nr:nucleoside deaminase [Gleimia hominis]MDT3766653.1 nucleoside deaminase [Gleimia hominis]